MRGEEGVELGVVGVELGAFRMGSGDGGGWWEGWKGKRMDGDVRFPLSQIDARSYPLRRRPAWRGL